jgi:hypothetical protein
MERRAPRHPQAPILPVSIVPYSDRALQIALIMDVVQRDGRGRSEPSVWLGLQPLVQAFLELVDFGERGAPGDVHGETFTGFVGPPTVDDEFVEELRVEVVGLRTVGTGEDSLIGFVRKCPEPHWLLTYCKEAHLFHDQVLFIDKASIASIEWTDGMSVSQITQRDRKRDILCDEQEHDRIERTAGRTAEDEAHSNTEGV